jgi:hypothetical protein
MSSHRELKRAQAEVIAAACEWAKWGMWSEFKRDERLADAVCTYQRLAEDLAARGGANGRATSNIAANTTLPAKEGVRRAIIVTLVAHWRRFHTGMTIAELKGRLRKEHSTVSSALNYVMNAGWVADSGDTRLTQHGKPAIVWVPTEKAIQATERMLGVA